jgi:hypothetical protein
MWRDFIVIKALNYFAMLATVGLLMASSATLADESSQYTQRTLPNGDVESILSSSDGTKMVTLQHKDGSIESTTEAADGSKSVMTQKADGSVDVHTTAPTKKD